MYLAQMMNWEAPILTCPLVFRGQPTKGLSPMERFMRAEEEQAAQVQSMAEDDLTSLIPAADDIADVSGWLSSSSLSP